MQKQQSDVVYHLDADDHLIVFNNAWNQFAAANDSPHLTQEHVNNRLVWDFIQDPETRHLHQTLLARVRRHNTTVTLPFRCDSPTMRRAMEMEIHPLPGGGIAYRCRIVTTESRPAMTLLDADVPHDERHGLLRMCSWCKKIDTGNDDWREVEEAVRHLYLFDSARLPAISHTMCTPCLETIGAKD